MFVLFNISCTIKLRSNVFQFTRLISAATLTKSKGSSDYAASIKIKHGVSNRHFRKVEITNTLKMFHNTILKY